MNKGDLVVIELVENEADDYSPLTEYNAVVVDIDESAIYLALVYLLEGANIEDFTYEDVDYVTGITLDLDFEPKKVIKAAKSEEESEEMLDKIMDAYILDFKDEIDEVSSNYPFWAFDMAIQQPDAS